MLRAFSNKEDAPGGGGSHGPQGVGPEAGGSLVQGRRVLGAERGVSEPWPGGPAGLRGNTELKHHKILCSVVGAVKIARSPEAT